MGFPTRKPLLSPRASMLYNLCTAFTFLLRVGVVEYARSVFHPFQPRISNFFDFIGKFGAVGPAEFDGDPIRAFVRLAVGVNRAILVPRSDSDGRSTVGGKRVLVEEHSGFTIQRVLLVNYTLVQKTRVVA